MHGDAVGHGGDQWRCNWDPMEKMGQVNMEKHVLAFRTAAGAFARTKAIVTAGLGEAPLFSLTFSEV